jgi:hypothetical protein
MSAQNPAFANPGRAAYELPKLLKNLGDVDTSVPLSADQRNTVEAIQSHAWGAVETITDGIESLGAIMSIVGNSEHVVGGRHFAHIGSLIEHLAVELQQLHEVETDMVEIVSVDNKQLATSRSSGAGKKRD